MQIQIIYGFSNAHANTFDFIQMQMQIIYKIIWNTSVQLWLLAVIGILHVVSVYGSCKTRKKTFWEIVIFKVKVLLTHKYKRY